MLPGPLTITPIEEQVAYQLIYAGCELEPDRFTSNIPINSQVWLAYWQAGFGAPRELLLTPHIESGTPALHQAVVRTLPFLAPDGAGPATPTPAADPGLPFIAANESHVLVHIDFFSLLRLLPLTKWWVKQVREPLWRHGGAQAGAPERIAEGLVTPVFMQWLARAVLEQVRDPAGLRQFKRVGQQATHLDLFGELGKAQLWSLRRLINVAALHVALSQLGLQGASRSMEAALADFAAASARVLKVLAACLGPDPAAPDGAPKAKSPLWSVSVNRPAGHAVMRSRKTIKADAAIRVFDTGGHGIRWAVIDSGIDATHPAFARAGALAGPSDFRGQAIRPSLSRVVRTLDFTRFAYLTSGRVSESLLRQLQRRMPREEVLRRAREIELALQRGQMLDWARLEPLLEVPHTDELYEPPHDSHGTHVAGILGGHWTRAMYAALPADARGVRQPLPIELEDGDVCGVCPHIELLDLRVFDPERESERGGEGSDEFAILAALQYVRHLNQSRDKQYVQGVNLSLSLRHDVRNYACGSTPVCMECERLVGSGVVVVAAAGNQGYDHGYAESHLGGAFRAQSITDPGNAPSVITVGSTHRTDPYRYGISYFSSHGPTGDGRNKPDLVAPGEKIVSTVPDAGLGDKDGTSMAAPHVCGVAALLLSRNTELIGQPGKVKDVLCRTATDLGRDKVFQGWGLVDALRALQAV